jgi:signal transduction histidine kinase
MVDNLLDATRLEEGRQPLAPAELALRGAAETAVAEIAERARLSSVTIAVEMPDDLKLTIDPTVLGTVLRNLLDNALKACVAGGGRSIALRGARTAHGVELAVADDGIGFPPEDAALIFEKFYRVGDELRRSMPGTGLGLYIVKRLVEQSGGAIAAQSGGPKRGATVTIRWPERAR